MDGMGPFNITISETVIHPDTFLPRVGENSARKRIRIAYPGEFGPHRWRTRPTTLENSDRFLENPLNPYNLHF